MKMTKHLTFSRFFVVIVIVAAIFSTFLVVTPEKASADLWEDQVGMSTSQGEVGYAYGERGGNAQDIRMVIANLIRVFLGFIGLIFLIMIIFAGFRWMTASGNQDQVTKARETLTRGIIGLLVIVAAYSIATFVTKVALETTSGQQSQEINVP